MKLPKWFKKFLRIFGVELHRLYYFEKDLREEIEAVDSRLELSIRQANEKDIEEIIALSEESEKKRIKKYAKPNSICYIARNKEEIAGYAWLNTKLILLDGIPIRKLAKKGVFGFGGFVFPEFRGKGVFKSLIAAYYQDMKDLKYDFFGNMTEVKNIPARKARETFHTKRVKVFIALLPFGLHIRFGKKIGQGTLIQ